jgi:PhzF family phenazine biosynthesis protein
MGEDIDSADPVTAVWTSVFADGPSGGNPCPVVFGGDEFSTDQMRARAHDYGVETVFVLGPLAGGGARLRYFVPLHEMSMCVHATVAATIVLAADGRLGTNPVSIETALGPLEVSWDLDTSSAIVSQFAPEFGPVLSGSERDLVLCALRIGEDGFADDVGPIRSVSTARTKLMIPVRDERTLDGIDPDFELLWNACDQLAVTGFYPFTVDAAGADAAARQFPRRSGYDEDPATGVAACALGAYLTAGTDASSRSGWSQWRVAQGRALGRPSLIDAASFRGERGVITRTRVGGQVRPDVRPAPQTGHSTDTG